MKSFVDDFQDDDISTSRIEKKINQIHDDCSSFDDKIFLNKLMNKTCMKSSESNIDR